MQYVEQSDPPEDRPELPPENGGEPASLPADAWTMRKLRRALGPHTMYGKDAAQRQAARTEAWSALLAAPYPPPRLRIGQLLIDMYEDGDEPGRTALVEIFRNVKMSWGVWQGFKRIYKRSEELHDSQMFGICAWRIDALTQTRVVTREISPATIQYMRRRAWRYLRQLGKAVPEVYPQFACQVLRHYPERFNFYASWVASQIWAHEDLKYSTSSWFNQAPDDLDRRAYHDTWKISPEPLLRLLEDAHNDNVCDFAIRGLREDHAETLRKVEPAWLARLGAKPLGSVHEFVVGVLVDSPELHQSKLAALGLHDMVLGLLKSSNAKACEYAVEYARAHAPDIQIDLLVELVMDGPAGDRTEFAMSRLTQKSPADIGLTRLAKLIGNGLTKDMAIAKIKEGFKPSDIDEDLFIQFFLGDEDQKDFIRQFFTDAGQKIPAAFLTAIVDRYEDERWDALEALTERDASEIGVEWIKAALMRPHLYDEIGEWLIAGKVKGDALDVEWVKGLIMRRNLRHIALSVLGNRELVEPGKIGLGWLLALARNADETLHNFAHGYLLEHFSPADFGGIDKLWTLASGKKEPAPVRAFASTYLQVHHPELGQTHPEARSLGITPKLTPDAYSLARVRPLFLDGRPDVRELAAAIGTVELVAWGDQSLLYDLADSREKESRSLAAQALLQIGEPDVDSRLVPPKEWLSPSRIFSLAESPIKSTREISLTLIRRHYAMLGGAQRLAWLMESPHREVRLFAVRLLWDRHRPLATPDDWVPPKKNGSGSSERFDSVQALRHFVRTVMFGLPPGRMERRPAVAGGVLPERPLPASVAKQRLVAVVRDMAVEDADFAVVVLPVLEEFMQSEAKGEWHACVAAIARIRNEHGIETVLPNAVSR